MYTTTTITTPRFEGSQCLVPTFLGGRENLAFIGFDWLAPESACLRCMAATVQILHCYWRWARPHPCTALDFRLVQIDHSYKSRSDV